MQHEKKRCRKLEEKKLHQNLQGKSFLSSFFLYDDCVVTKGSGNEKQRETA